MKELNSTVSSFKESIFATMSKLSFKEKAINLSQGYPDFDGPKFAIDAAVEACLKKGSTQQYAPLMGIENLRSSLSSLYKEQYHLDYNKDSEVTIVNGATEGIFSTLLSVLNPGDEVIIFEPFYDSYLATIKLAGAIPIPVTLHAPEFRWDSQELKSAFNRKTKLVILNNPHNPSGRVFSSPELIELSNLIIKNDCYAFSDEVYEFLTYDNHKHICIASLDGMKERTYITSSLGKTFGFTGWKIGWVLAPQNMSFRLRMVHQYNTFSVNHPFQDAAAHILNKLPSYIPQLKQTYQNKRDYFIKEIKNVGLTPITPEGTYFSLCKIPKGHSDIEYCQYLIKEKKVATIPPSAFYLKSPDGEKYLRFCFAKDDRTIKEAMLNLKSLKL